MKKYRLKKDHPYAKSGVVVNGFYNGFGDFCFEEPTKIRQTMACIPATVEHEWLEEVEERWRPDDGQMYWSVVYKWSGKYEVSYDHWDDEETDRNFLEAYNCFQTREQAEECAKLCLETRKKYTESLNQK